ncbi:MAG: hypothetical protein JWM88_2799 [Verrucomicrobia bacterium]|nr:hypothetical protein [Verrucomicrobiota bacterium]
MNPQPTLPSLLAQAWRTLFALAVALIVISSGFSNDQARTSADRDNDTAGPSSQHFWKRAAMCGRKEVAYSELAATRANRPEVRSYAQQLVTDHHQMRQDLMAARGHGTTAAMKNDNATAVDAYSSTAARTPNTFSPTAGNPQAADTAAHPSENVTDAVAVDAPPRRDSTTVTARSSSSVNDNATAVDAYSSHAASTAGTYSTVSGNPQAGDTAEHPSEQVTDAVAVDAPLGRDDMAVTSPGDGRSYFDLTNDTTYRQLTATNGVEFDRAYLKAMEDDHRETIRLFERAAANNSDPSVQNFASKYLPTLRQHLAQAQQLETSVE